MAQSPQKTPPTSIVPELSFRNDYYGGDFVEDGSFLVLSTDNLSLSPGTPNGTGEDIEVVNEVDEDEMMEEDVPQGNQSMESQTTQVEGSLAKSQVAGEDVESSAESSKTNSMHGNNASSSNHHLDATLTNMSTTSSVSTDTHLAETGEEMNLLVSDNKKLMELLAETNEKMKVMIVTTERLNAEHEEHRKNNEASREKINQLKQENDVLRSQIESGGNSSNREQDSVQRNSYEVSELNERLKTVLNVNGQLNDQLFAAEKTTKDLKAELATATTKLEEEMKKVQAMQAEIESGRETIKKFKEHQDIAKAEVESARTLFLNLEGVVEEKTRMVDSLKRNMEDTIVALERCNVKLNEKEEQVSLLTTKLAAINAETEIFDRIQVLEMQCQSYKSDFEKVREEKAKLAAEKDALLIELNAANQQLRTTTDTLDNLRRQNGEQFEPEYLRNDNFATNSANEPLQSPLTSLPTVAGQLVGFVRRELLGWEDQATATSETNPNSSGDASGASASGGSNNGSVGTGGAEAVVQQPKQDRIPPCPICRKTFPSVERLQMHASNCGIDDENPQDPFVFP